MVCLPPPDQIEVRCHRCRGHGQVSAYTADGFDFLGASECCVCDGSGQLTRYAGGALAKYPGGPFVGRDTHPEPVTNAQT